MGLSSAGHDGLCAQTVVLRCISMTSKPFPGAPALSMARQDFPVFLAPCGHGAVDGASPAAGHDRPAVERGALRRQARSPTMALRLARLGYRGLRALIGRKSNLSPILELSQ